jgi:hypothetical protein
MNRITANDLRMFTYNIQIHHSLSECAEDIRVAFCDSFLQFSGTSDFTQEAHFNLDGYVNKQNKRT